MAMVCISVILEIQFCAPHMIHCISKISYMFLMLPRIFFLFINLHLTMMYFLDVVINNLNNNSLYVVAFFDNQYRIYLSE
jgi:hypothetical protein